MRGRITKGVTEVVNDPKARRAATRAAEHAAKEFWKKFRQEYWGVIDEERKNAKQASSANFLTRSDVARLLVVPFFYVG